jgi:hypothetical protein
VNTDFADIYPTAQPSAGASTAPLWDVTAWDEAFWGGTGDMQIKYTSVRGNGDCAAIRWRVNDQAADIAVSAFDLLFEPGGLVG